MLYVSKLKALTLALSIILASNYLNAMDKNEPKSNIIVSDEIEYSIYKEYTCDQTGNKIQILSYVDNEDNELYKKWTYDQEGEVILKEDYKLNIDDSTSNSDSELENNRKKRRVSIANATKGLKDLKRRFSDAGISVQQKAKNKAQGVWDCLDGKKRWIFFGIAAGLGVWTLYDLLSGDNEAIVY